MRDIKFRFWDTVNKIMCPWEDIDKFNAVYFNGVQIVRKGKVFY